MGRLQANVRRAAVKVRLGLRHTEGQPSACSIAVVRGGGGESHQARGRTQSCKNDPSFTSHSSRVTARPPPPSLRDCVASQRMSGGDVNPFFAVCRQVLRVICCRDEPPVQSRSFKRKPMPRYMVYHDANETLVHRQLEVSRSARFACMTFFAFRSLEDDP